VAHGAPKITIPIPIGLYDFFREHPINQLTHDPAFHPDSAAFNPVELLNLVLNPPIFLDIRRPATPTNNVEFTIGKNQLIMNLGQTRVIIPDQSFGVGTSGRLLDMGFNVGGFNASVMGFVHYDLSLTLDSALRSVLKDTVPVRPDSSTSSLPMPLRKRAGARSVTPDGCGTRRGWQAWRAWIAARAKDPSGTRTTVSPRCSGALLLRRHCRGVGGPGSPWAIDLWRPVSSMIGADVEH
jgi:hypothetical protein